MLNETSFPPRLGLVVVIPVLYLTNSVGVTGGNSRFFSQLIMAVRRNVIANICENLLIVVNYHVGCIESKVSVRIIEDELKCVLAAFEAVL